MAPLNRQPAWNRRVRVRCRRKFERWVSDIYVHCGRRIGYRLELLDNREDSYEWGSNFTLTGQCYGIGEPAGGNPTAPAAGGNYAAEDVVREDDRVNVIAYWSRDENGEMYKTPFKGEYDVKLDSESGQFFAYMDSESAAESLVASLREWMDRLENCYS